MPWIHQSFPLIINCGYFFRSTLLSPTSFPLRWESTTHHHKRPAVCIIITELERTNLKHMFSILIIHITIILLLKWISNEKTLLICACFNLTEILSADAQQTAVPHWMTWYGSENTDISICFPHPSQSI